MTSLTITKLSFKASDNFTAVRLYLGQLEALISEAQRTKDPRVIRTALCVLATQGEMAQKFLGAW